jgi:hypothetical protein
MMGDVAHVSFTCSYVSILYDWLLVLPLRVACCLWIFLLTWGHSPVSAALHGRCYWCGIFPTAGIICCCHCWCGIFSTSGSASLVAATAGVVLIAAASASGAWLLRLQHGLQFTPSARAVLGPGCCSCSLFAAASAAAALFAAGAVLFGAAASMARLLVQYCLPLLLLVQHCLLQELSASFAFACE